MPTLMSASTKPVVERDHRPGDQRQQEGQHRRGEEDDAVGAARDDRLLEQQLEAVGERLQQAERADDVGPLAQLHRRQDLALGVGQVGDRDQQRHDDQQDLADDDRRRPRRSRSRRSQPCGAGLPCARRDEGRRALGHGRRGAADRVGHVEIRDRRAERRRLHRAGGAERSPGRRRHRLRMLPKTGFAATSRARTCVERVVGQPLAERLGQRADDLPVLARLAGREHGQPRRAARGPRC